MTLGVASRCGGTRWSPKGVRQRAPSSRTLRSSFRCLINALMVSSALGSEVSGRAGDKRRHSWKENAGDLQAGWRRGGGYT